MVGISVCAAYPDHLQAVRVIHGAGLQEKDERSVKLRQLSHFPRWLRGSS